MAQIILKKGRGKNVVFRLLNSRIDETNIQKIGGFFGGIFPFKMKEKRQKMTF